MGFGGKTPVSSLPDHNKLVLNTFFLLWGTLYTLKDYK